MYPAFLLSTRTMSLLSFVWQLLLFVCVACHVVWRVQAEAVERARSTVIKNMCPCFHSYGMSRCVACTGRSNIRTFMCAGRSYVRTFICVWHVTLYGVYRQKQYPYFHVWRQNLRLYFHLCVACHVVWRVQAEAVKRARSTVIKNMCPYFHSYGTTR